MSLQPVLCGLDTWCLLRHALEACTYKAGECRLFWEDNCRYGQRWKSLSHTLPFHLSQLSTDSVYWARCLHCHGLVLRWRYALSDTKKRNTRIYCNTAGLQIVKGSVGVDIKFLYLDVWPSLCRTVCLTLEGCVNIYYLLNAGGVGVILRLEDLEVRVFLMF